MQFVAAVSHELRTPLAVIRSAAENIAEGVVSDPEQAKRYGHLIESEGRRLTGMVEQVLAHAGMGTAARQSSRLYPVDVSEVVRRVVEAAAPLATREHCQVQVQVEQGLPAALADESLLRSAIENLVANALKHASRGGWVGIAARRGTPPHPVERRNDSNEVVEHIEIAVSDCGPGIDPDDLGAYLRRVLPRPVGRRRPGVGQRPGSQSREAVGRADGGRVDPEMPIDGGARFVLTIPAARGTWPTEAYTS